MEYYRVCYLSPEHITIDGFYIQVMNIVLGYKTDGPSRSVHSDTPTSIYEFFSFQILSTSFLKAIYFFVIQWMIQEAFNHLLHRIGRNKPQPTQYINCFF